MIRASQRTVVTEMQHRLQRRDYGRRRHGPRSKRVATQITTQVATEGTRQDVLSECTTAQRMRCNTGYKIEPGYKIERKVGGNPFSSAGTGSDVSDDAPASPQCVSNAWTRSLAMALALRPSIFRRSMTCTGSPSFSNATKGDEGGIPARCSRKRCVASRSWPANTVTFRSGCTGWRSAMAIAGRALAAAQPHTVLITTSVVPCLLSSSMCSTAAASRNSSMPNTVRTLGKEGDCKE